MTPERINREASQFSNGIMEKYRKDESATSWWKRVFIKFPYNNHDSNQVHSKLHHADGCTCYYCDR